MPSHGDSPRRGVGRGAPSFSAGDMRALARALRTLLSPLDHPDWQAWRQAAHHALLEVTGADAVGMLTPIVEGFDAWHAPHLPPAVLHEYVVSRHIRNRLLERFVASGAAVAHHSQLAPADARTPDVLYHEFARPHRLFDLTLAAVHLGTGATPALLHFTNEGRERFEPDLRRLALVQAVLPAFGVGLETWRRIGTAGAICRGPRRGPG